MPRNSSIDFGVSVKPALSNTTFLQINPFTQADDIKMKAVRNAALHRNLTLFPFCFLICNQISRRSFLLRL